MAAHDQRKWFFPVHCRRFYLHPFYVFAHEKRSPFVIWLLFLYGIPKYLNNQRNARFCFRGFKKWPYWEINLICVAREKSKIDRPCRTIAEFWWFLFWIIQSIGAKEVTVYLYFYPLALIWVSVSTWVFNTEGILSNVTSFIT